MMKFTPSLSWLISMTRIFYDCYTQKDHPASAQFCTFLGIIGLALVYCAVGEVSMMVNVVHGQVASIWPAAGVGFAVLFLGKGRLWPGIWLGEVIDLFISEPLTSQRAITATGNTLALLVGILFIHRFVSGHDLLSRPIYITLFLLGACLATLVSTGVGVSSLYFYHLIQDSQLLVTAWTWSIADFVGILVVAPVIISWHTHRHLQWYHPQSVEALFIFVSLCVLAWMIFGQTNNEAFPVYPLTFLLMPFPIWAAFRFSQRETMLVIFLISLIAVVGTMKAKGPFVQADLYDSLLLLQTFVAVICITTLFLISVINERSELEASLRHSQCALQQVNEELEQRVEERTETLKVANEELRKTTEKYQSIFLNTIEGIYQVSPEGKLLNANPALAKMYGYESPEEMIQQITHLDELYIDPQRRMEFHFVIHDQKTVYEFESVVRRRGGEMMCISENSRAVHDEQGHLLYYEGTMIDITGRKEAEKQLIKMAHYDPLTGLGNRRLFQIRLTQALARTKESGKSGILMYFDLDGFKKVNDTLGHEFGDELLKQVAHRLKHCMRESDIVCRLGGDEFTVIAENVVRPQDAITVAKKLLTTLSSPYSYQEQEAKVGVSIGITFFEGHHYTTDELINQADQAMYLAKQRGKGTYCFYNNVESDLSSSPLVGEH